MNSWTATNSAGPWTSFAPSPECRSLLFLALRNHDMDELSTHPEIAAGCPVDGVGREFTRAGL